MKLFVCLLSLVALGAATPGEEEKDLWNAIGDFGHQLTSRVHQNGENLLISPLSVHTALGMAMMGAQGETFDQMWDALGLNSTNLEKLSQAYTTLLSRRHAGAKEVKVGRELVPRDDFYLGVHNRMYITKSKPVLAPYAERVKKLFYAQTLNVDFANDGEEIKNQINEYVSDRTHGLVRDVLPQPLNANTLLALVNTLYFNGSWKSPLTEQEAEVKFNEGCENLEATKREWLAKDTYFLYRKSERLGAEFIQIPYVSDSFDASMLIALPFKKHNCNADQWFNTFTWRDIRQEIKDMKYEYVNFTLPKFEASSRFELQNILPGLGMTRAFALDQAQFGRIVKDGKLNIDQVIHQTKMTVTKYGTEAAAGTTIGFTRVASPVIPPKPIQFHVNRSFYVSLLYMHHSDLSTALPLLTGLVHSV